MKTNYAHVYEGGTMITNFDATDYNMMIKAIKSYHKSVGKSILTVKKKAFYNMGKTQLHGDYSLHVIDDKMQDLSEFWEIYDNLKGR